MRVFATLCFLVSIASTTQANPRPFIATYSANIDLLIDVPATATRTLNRTDSDTWQFESHASAIFAKQTERSELRLTETGWSPVRYRYDRTLLGRARSIAIEFDKNAQRVTTIAKGEPWVQPWEAGVQDRLSYQLQLRNDLANQKESLDYRIADGGQIKHYRFKRLGEEQLTTQAGTFTCERLQLERQGQQHTTLLWMAKSLDYLTVRLIRIDADGKEHILNLKSLEFLD